MITSYNACTLLLLKVNFFCQNSFLVLPALDLSAYCAHRSFSFSDYVAFPVDIQPHAIPRPFQDRIFLMCLTISGFISSCDCPAPFLKQGQWSTNTGNTNIYVYVAPTLRKRNELTWEQGMHTTKWHQFAGRWWFDTLPHKGDLFGMVTESNGMVGGWYGGNHGG